MTESRTIELANRVREAFAGRMALDIDQITELVGDKDTAARCIGFLRDRDEVLLVTGTRFVYHRPTLVERVWSLVKSHGPLSPEEINRELSLPSAVSCEVLGWLEHEGRLCSHGDEGTISVESV